MTPKVDPEAYDEDCVFNRLFAAETKPRSPTKGERLASIFADATSTEPNIQVSDFLPSY